MDPLVTLNAIQKRYGSIEVLKDVSLSLARGEVHALVGENGAGKSTLMNILAGVVRMDAGALLLSGRDCRFSSTHEARIAGIATVFQELSLVDGLSVEENICAGHPPVRFGLIDRAEMRRRAKAALHRLRSDIAPGKAVSTLSASQRQVVEIAKAIDQLLGVPAGLANRVLILDEPTSALGAEEKQALFAAVNRLKADGIGMIYISHHLSEVMGVADRITVLRDGAVVWTRPRHAVTIDDIVRAMVGRDVHRTERHRAVGQGVAARFVNVELAGRLKGVSFDLLHGEVLAVAGLDGSGREHVGRLLAGLDVADTGQIELLGGDHPGRFRRVLDAGVGYIPDDRKNAGLFLDMSVAANAVVTDLASVTRRGFVKDRILREQGLQAMTRHRVKASGPDQKVGALSGGNQQKILFAKWLRRKPALLVIEEPTKGVDVGSKREIHDEIVAHARTGAAVLVVSSDLPEILEIADRILVLHRGRICGILDGETATEQAVMEMAAGSVTAAAS